MSKSLAENRKALFDYQILKKYEAGLVLSGQEVKSVKTGHISLKGSFVTLHDNELFLINADIPPYIHYAGKSGYDSRRSRKILLKKQEIASITGKMHAQGLTLIPLKIYTRNRYLKVEIALAKGKKEYDKRETIKKRDAQRKMAHEIKNR
jgi:SsrA-binding protein